ncbi:MAG: ABC transporter ATP-binding protein [Candidatus Neomarinimicrobiota bacterium]
MPQGNFLLISVLVTVKFGPMLPAIEVRDLRKSYGETVALRGISLSIQQGEFYGLLGPNGAGKTTTIGIITGLVKLQQGSVNVLGKDIVRNYRFTRSKIGVSPQEFTSDWFFSIEKLLSFQAGYYGIPKKQAQPKVDEVLKQFGLDGKRHSKIRHLSGGMKRRFQIAKSLVNDPEILILDEPTAGVDVELRRMLWNYLRRLHKEGKTILLTTHYIEEAEQLCQRVAIINDGSIVAEDTPERLVRSLGKGSIEVELSGWNTNQESRLSELDFVYEPGMDRGRLIFTVENPAKELTRIVEALSADGCHIHEVKIAKSSLEDVFVSLTGRAINE